MDKDFRHWISRTIIVGIILLFIIYLIQEYFKIQLLAHTIIAITIVLFLGFFHELLHYYKATKLGYTTTWYRTKVTMGFEVSHSKNDKWYDDEKKIARIPYYFIVPISIIFLFIGIYYMHFGLSVAGFTSLLLHGFSYTQEGRTKSRRKKHERTDKDNE